jgi:3-oxoacyl-[acyl-carrier-protein] synthase II
MSRLVITQAAVATALGSSLDQTWRRLLAGESGVKLVERFDASRLVSRAAACVEGLETGAGHDPVEFLASLVLEQLPALERDTYFIWCGIKDTAQRVESEVEGRAITGRGSVREYRDWAREKLKLDAWGMEVNAACVSSTVGLALAAMRLKRGLSRRVLVAGADWVSRFVFTGFASLKALSPTVCRPFDSGRDGLVLGDGAAAVLLETEEAARESGREPLAELSGWGMANDANHITGPARDGSGLSAATRAALKTAGAAADEVGAICAHGTGTSFNDAMELTSLEAVFGSRRFPVFGIKGALGHSLGAVGALETALCVRALREKTVPPTAGLENPEPRAEGRASNKPQAFSGSILTTNSGFGGLNAALLLKEIR